MAGKLGLALSRNFRGQLIHPAASEDNGFLETGGNHMFISSLWTDKLWFTLCFTILVVQKLSNSTKK